MDAKLKPRFILEAVIKRADGTIEDLGVIAESQIDNKEDADNG
jgi:hypothetical protein